MISLQGSQGERGDRGETGEGGEQVSNDDSFHLCHKACFMKGPLFLNILVPG